MGGITLHETSKKRVGWKEVIIEGLQVLVVCIFIKIELTLLKCTS